MNTARILAASLVFTVATAPLAAAPRDGSTTVEAGAAGLKLAVTTRPDITEHDAIRVVFLITNDTDRARTVDIDDDAITFELTTIDDEGDPKKVRAVRLGDRDVRQSPAQGNYKPEPGETVRHTGLDLRELTGRLEPGRYAIRVVVPPAALTFIDEDVRHNGLRSPAIAIEVAAVDLAAVMKTARETPPVLSIEFNTPREIKGREGKVRTVTITNNADAAASLIGYPMDTDAGQPRSVVMSYQQYHPDRGWFAPDPLGLCGTGLGHIAIGPRKSIEAFPFQMPQHDGVYRLSAADGRAVSEPFVKDTLAAREPDADREAVPEVDEDDADAEPWDQPIVID